MNRQEPIHRRTGMTKEELMKKIKQLKAQQEQAKELYIKCEGAIEMLNTLIEDTSKNKKK